MTGTIDRLLREPTGNLWVQLFRYFFVGGLAFAVDFGLLYLLTEYAGMHYTVSATVSFMAGLLVNYLISIRWVFRERVMRDRKAEFVVYGLIGVVGIGLNVAIIWVVTEYLSAYYLASKIVAAVIVFLWNFFARKYILFHERR